MFFGISFSQIYKVNDKSEKGIPYVIIITDTQKALSNEKGYFKLDNSKIKHDSIGLLLLKNGFLDLKVKIHKDEKNKSFVMYPDTITHLREVVITAKKRIKNANKKTYKIDPNKFNKNSKADIVIQTLPNISINNNGLLINNNRKIILFIDGIEASIEELKRLDIKEIDKIEVISNPSVSYGSNFFGAVINIILKNNKSRFYKGEIETFKGVRLNLFGIIPSLSFKTKNLTFKSFYSWSNNNQNINSILKRNQNGENFIQSSQRNVSGWQDFSFAKLKIDLSNNFIIYLRATLSRYNFNSITTGDYIIDNDNNKFEIIGNENLKKGYISSIFKYKLSKNSNITSKYKFFDYTEKNKIDYNIHSLNNYTFSNIQEHSFELVYRNNKSSLFNKQFNYSIGNRLILRDFNFNETPLNFKQYINTVYFDNNISINNNFSIFSSYALDLTDSQENISIYFLPTLSVSYKLNKKSDIYFGYSRKITRPSPENLNSNIIYFNPGFILKGNPKLKAQIRNYLEAQYNYKFSNEQAFNIYSYYENINDGIVQTISISDDNTIIEYSNASDIFSYGLNFGYTGKLFKYIYLNLNSGINYYSYNTTTGSLISSNNGFSINSNMYISTKLKNNVYISFSGNYNSPKYSLIHKTINEPYLSLSAEKTLLKDKMTIKISYNDIFSLSSKINKTSIGNNYFQSEKIINNMSNITFSLVYSFGKKFNTHYNEQIINTNDIKLK